MTGYAEATDVSSERSRSEIEKTLVRYGATAFAYGWQATNAVISFEARGRRVRFVLPLPDRASEAFCLTSHNPPRPLSAEQATARYEQAVRQKWRALALCIKAKLEAVNSGITQFEDEFLAHVVLPSGDRVGDWLKPQLAIAYQQGSMPPLLPYHGKDSV